jgi:membrane fusion protein, multidrug efflux system
VAVVEPNNTVHLENVALGLNLGSTVQVESGLTAADRVIDNPSDGLLEGQAVRIVPGEKAVALPSQETHPDTLSADTTVASAN